MKKKISLILVLIMLMLCMTSIMFGCKNNDNNKENDLPAKFYSYRFSAYSLNYKPIENIEIYDKDNNLLGITDSFGNFDINSIVNAINFEGRFTEGSYVEYKGNDFVVKTPPNHSKIVFTFEGEGLHAHFKIFLDEKQSELKAENFVNVSGRVASHWSGVTFTGAKLVLDGNVVADATEGSGNYDLKCISLNQYLTVICDKKIKEFADPNDFQNVIDKKGFLLTKELFEKDKVLIFRLIFEDVSNE